MHANIREATPADLPRILALLDANGLPTVGVADCLDGFLVGESGGEIVGVVGVESCCREYALLRSTAVSAAAPPTRRSGRERSVRLPAPIRST